MGEIKRICYNSRPRSDLFIEGCEEFVKQKIRDFQRRALDWTVLHHPNLGLDKRAENFVKLFETNLSAGSRVLDVGGGWGFYYEPLSKRGHKPVVLDVVKPGIQKAPVIVYDGENIPFPDKSFDASMFITVLHHIPDIDQVVQEVKRVTKKTLIVVEDIYHHSLGRLWTQWRDQFYNFEFVGHPCHFKKSDEWVTFFEEHGFQLKEKKQVYTWLSGLRILNGVFIFELPDVS